MRTPHKGSLAYRILFHLYRHGPKTAIELSAEVNVGIDMVYSVAASHGLPKPARHYAITDKLRKWFDDETVEKETFAPQIVPPPYRTNIFAGTLSPKYRISALGTRDGSNDHLQIKSKFGKN